MAETHVVTVFLRNGTDVLLLRRSDEVGSYPGQWGAVAGHAEGDPDGAAREEIREETDLDGHVTFVRAGDPFPVDDPDHGRWVVHPYLFDCDARAVEPNYETADYEWAPPTDILRRETVPDLWTSYARVAPSVETVAGDTEHGSAYVSVRALETLRDRAAALAAGRASVADPSADLAALARDLVGARPSMRALANRVNRAMDRAADRSPSAVEAAASGTIADALAADADAAREAAALPAVAGGRVLTLSRSGTVRETLDRAAPAAVLVAESRPAREGVGVAESLAAEAGADVVLFVDAAAAHVLATRAVDAVVVGADTVLADGRVVNKVGTRAVALAAAREGVPVYAVTARDKVAPDATPDREAGPPEAVYDGDAPVEALNPTFDATPADCVTVVTEDGPLATDEVGEVAAEMARLADWCEGDAGATHGASDDQ